MKKILLALVLSSGVYAQPLTPEQVAAMQATAELLRADPQGLFQGNLAIVPREIGPQGLFQPQPLSSTSSELKTSGEELDVE